MLKFFFFSWSWYTKDNSLFSSSYLCSQRHFWLFIKLECFMGQKQEMFLFGLDSELFHVPIFSRTMSSWKRSGTGSSEPLRPASQQSHTGTLWPATSPQASFTIATQTGQLITASTHLHGLTHSGWHVPKAQSLPGFTSAFSIQNRGEQKLHGQKINSGIHLPNCIASAK